MINSGMSAKKIIYKEVNDLPPLKTSKKSEKVSSPGRVDINILLNRARKTKEKETRSNLVFAGLMVSLVFVFVVGVIL